MSYELSGGLVALYLSPALRGAKDSLREPIEKLLRSPVTLRVASQQVSDRGIVNALAGARTERGEQALVLIESDYLYERTPVPPQSIWTQGGEREEHRQCLLALMRSGVKVREDQMGSALQHVNMIIAERKNGLNAALLTSANLAPGSLDKHFNWGLSITDAAVCAALSAAFGEAWDGDFREVQLDYTKTFGDAEYLQVCGGAQGQAVDLAVKAIESAQDTIRFAYFNVARDSRVSRALAAAAARGVKVAGVVDGDQEGTAWDAVPGLRAAGVDARYYPGALTGALGRMHYKAMAIDAYTVHLATANASQAAETSFELGIALRGGSGIGNPLPYVKDEITRLIRGAGIPGASP